MRLPYGILPKINRAKLKNYLKKYKPDFRRKVMEEIGKHKQTKV